MVLPFQQVVGEILVFQFEAGSIGGEIPVVFGVVMQSGVIGEIMGVFDIIEILVTVLAFHQVGKVVEFPGSADVELQVAYIKLEEFQDDGMGVEHHAIALTAFVVHVDLVVLEFIG